ncbi:MAG: alpha-tubulin suppressor-like RCC1 family protein [Rickettsiales bacterium]|jgi:alpha-tubulin suppressor-like RCC1 family protein
MTQKYYCIITDKGLQKEAASKLENSEPLSLVKIAVGDGGGAYYDPTSDATSLVNECYRTKDEHPINVVVDDNHPNQVIIEGLIPEDTDGKSFYIREVGVFDSDGDLFAIGKYPETYKTNISEGSNKRLYVRMILAFVTKLNVEVRVSQDINLDPNFASNVHNELNNRLKISENFADLSNPVDARDNLGVYDKNRIDAGLEEKLQKSSNLSDLANKSTARDNLEVYDRTTIDDELDDRLKKISNLDDLTNKAAARANLNVYNKTEVDGKVNARLNAEDNLSDLTSFVNARNSLGVYSQAEVDGLDNVKLQKSANLSDLTNKSSARANLNVYNKTEIDGKVNARLNADDNLSDLTSFVNARNSLGVYSKAEVDGLDNGRLQKSANLSDLNNFSTARGNLDVYQKGDVDSRVNAKLNSASNLSDLPNKEIARNNLGLGNSSLMSAGIIQISSQAEVDAGINSTKAITPKTLADHADISEILQNHSGKLVGKLPSSRTSRHHMAVIMKDGNIKVWGRGDHHETTDPGGSHQTTPMVLSVDPIRPPTSKFVQVALAVHCGYALDADGRVYSWGYNGYGHLGHGDTVNKKYAKRIEYFVSNNIRIKEIITNNEIAYDSGSAVLFLATNGRVYGCGDNQYGVLGDGSRTHRYTPVRIGTLENIIQIVLTCGNAGGSAYFRTSSQELWVTGYNSYGQLGVGTTTDVVRPTKIQGYSNITHISASGGVVSGTAGSAIFIDSGKIYTAGYNGYGQLGLGHTTYKTTFQRVGNFSNIIDAGMVGGGYATSYIIDSGGNLLLSGYNGYGQLGRGNTTSASTFLAPTGGDLGFQGNIKQVLSGGDRSAHNIIILDNDGQIYGAGYGHYGQLSQGDWAVGAHAIFKKAINSKIAYENRKCIDITSAGYYSDHAIFALYDDGTVRTAGYNGYYMQGRDSGDIHAKIYTDIIF